MQDYKTCDPILPGTPVPCSQPENQEIVMLPPDPKFLLPFALDLLPVAEYNTLKSWRLLF